MTYEQVNEHIQRFGDIKSSYRSRKNIGGRSVHIGIHTYNIILKKPIPPFIQIGGRPVKTKYTGQERHLPDERDRKLQERRQQNEERQRQIDLEHEEYMNTSFTDDNNTDTVLPRLSGRVGHRV